MNFLLAEFERHHARMVERARERLEAVQLTNLVDAGRVKTSVSEDDLLGKRLPRDEFQGDTNFRTLKALLKKVDERGYERSAHQLGTLASVFERTVSVPHCFPTPTRVGQNSTKTSSRPRRASCTRTTGACKSPASCRSTAGSRVPARC